MNKNRIYEVIRYEEGVGLFLEDHLERLFASLKNSFLICNLTIDEINTYYEERKDTLPSPVNMRIDIGQEGCQITFRDPIAVEAKMYEEGVAVKAVPVARKNPNVKSDTDSYYAQMAQTYEKEGYFEYLLYDNGIIKEGARSNFFAVKDGRVYTQDSQNVLMGITRKKILEILENLQIEVCYEDVHLDEIADFDGCFLSGTSIGVMPIKKIDDFAFTGAQNELIKRVLLAYNECVAKYIAQRSKN